MSGWESYAQNDCIVHHCRTCQYEWKSKPLAVKRSKVGKSESPGA